MPLERQLITADAQFWPVAARCVTDFAGRCGSAANQLHAMTWLVPSGAHAVLARAGLREAIRGAAFVPPRIVPLAHWLRQPLQTGIAARAELFSALRGNAWVRESFGTQPVALWALARGVAQLCDELTWAAVADADAFAGRLEASLARHYFRRASRALQPQAQLVLQLWRARRADDSVARALREIEARAGAAETPLVYMAGEALQGWEQAFLQRYSQRAPVLLIEPDVAATLAARPMLAAAWPELAGADTRVPMAVRADAVQGSAAPLAIVRAASLEEEATAVAQQVLDWRRDGVASIALVALDRLTARRARALLERAQVSVRDETGWKLSTTSAAASVMRWLDLVADDVYWRDLLDWLKSPFTLVDRDGKSHEVAIIERAIRMSSTLQGARAIRRALASLAERDAAAETQSATDLLSLIETQAQLAQRAGPTLAAHLRALGAALAALGMRNGLATDPVGAAVLRGLDALEAELSGVTGRASLADFRALLAERFEEVAFVDRQIDSPVVMVSLEATHLRPFDAALLIGADAQHLPTAPSELLFMSNAVRAELGLITAEAALRTQAAQLATLLATVPRVIATWRTHRDDEPNTISPLLERLQFVAARAAGDDLVRGTTPHEFEAEGVAQHRPAPSAPRLLPTSISASQAQSLVNCAYQFYARRLLQLAELDDVIEMPDKRDFGDALHEVLRRFHREWGAVDFGTLDGAQLAASLAQHARAVFEPQLERTPGLLAFQHRFLGLIDGYIEWLREHSKEGWRWQTGEEKLTQQLTLRDGREVELRGRIDRIDTRADHDVRVLDYKARAADVLKRELKAAGEDIQLPFYGLLLARRAQSAAYVSFDRAREGEGGVHAVEPPHPFAELVDSVGTRLQSDVQRIADGAPLPAIGVDAVCEHCEMRGLCRRDFWERSGDDEEDAQ